MWDNIPKDKQHNFKKYFEKDADLQGLPYDTGSVMHYSATAFGRGKKTIISKTGATLGQRNGFSSSDLVGINKLYCDGDGPNPTKPKCEDKNVGCSGWAKAGYVSLETILSYWQIFAKSLVDCVEVRRFDLKCRKYFYFMEVSYINHYHWYLHYKVRENVPINLRNGP